MNPLITRNNLIRIWVWTSFVHHFEFRVRGTVLLPRGVGEILFYPVSRVLGNRLHPDGQTEYVCGCCVRGARRYSPMRWLGASGGGVDSRGGKETVVGWCRGGARGWKAFPLHIVVITIATSPRFRGKSLPRTHGRLESWEGRGKDPLDHILHTGNI